MRLLIVEDNEKLAYYTKKGLEKVGYSVDVNYDGIEAEKSLLVTEYDAILLDIMIPKKNGMTLCVEIRQKGISTPIIMLTAKGSTKDIITGLDSGADDYIVKPFDLGELDARIRALLRRPQTEHSSVISIKSLSIDEGKRIVSIDKKEIFLSVKEYAILHYLARNPGKVISREQIIDHCWDHAFEHNSNIVDVYIKRIRNKISPLDHEEFIETIRGVGYRIKE